jgi:hypothetical protein
MVLRPSPAPSPPPKTHKVYKAIKNISILLPEDDLDFDSDEAEMITYMEEEDLDCSENDCALAKWNHVCYMSFA